MKTYDKTPKGELVITHEETVVNEQKVTPKQIQMQKQELIELNERLSKEIEDNKQGIKNLQELEDKCVELGVTDIPEEIIA